MTANRRMFLLVHTVGTLRLNQPSCLEFHTLTNYVQTLLTNIPLRQLSSVLPKQALREVYFGIIHSHICYGILLWCGLTKSNRVFILEKRAVRVLDGIEQDVSCRESFKKFNILPLPCIFILESLVSTHRNRYNLLRHSDIHNYNTRTAGNLVSTYSRLDITTKNKVDVNLYNMFLKKFEHTNCRNMSIASFRILVKNYLLEQCLLKIVALNFSNLDQKFACHFIDSFRQLMG
nr:unnamed protein product [Callosobruchus analis]